jgi:hypothetical protein
MSALFAEGLDDFGIRNGVIHEGVDAPAELFGEAGDGAGEAFVGRSAADGAGFWVGSDMEWCG